MEAPSSIGRQTSSRGRLPAFGGRNEATVAKAVVLPGQLLLLFIVLFPAALAIYIGFTNWSPTTGDDVWHAYRYWHWFDGYWEALTTQNFWIAMGRTIWITVAAVAVEFLLGFALALLLLKQFRGKSIVTVFFLLPMMVVPAVSGFVFFMLFQVDGPVNQGLSAILPGDVSVQWLQDASLAIWTVILADIWQWTPLMFLIFLSGLAALPEDQMNAARILGAGWWSQMRMLVLPMMKPIILIALVIRSIEAFKLFDPIYLMTQGGPGDATENISLYLFDETITNVRWGYASSVAILVLIFVSIVGFWAIRPIERAQDESLDQGIDLDTKRDVKIEDAIEAEARV